MSQSRHVTSHRLRNCIAKLPNHHEPNRSISYIRMSNNCIRLESMFSHHYREVNLKIFLLDVNVLSSCDVMLLSIKCGSSDSPGFDSSKFTVKLSSLVESCSFNSLFKVWISNRKSPFSFYTSIQKST